MVKPCANLCFLLSGLPLEGLRFPDSGRDARPASKAPSVRSRSVVGGGGGVSLGRGLASKNGSNSQLPGGLQEL